ncbi:MAG: hypothetical protein JST31_16540 [Actinobacteria bacterium]|nr:hypothetical protein [Actinomycetota bacterium]
MSILDDAIREHLELKRAHGADEAELKRLEDEAFGPAERPDQGGDQLDPFAEAPTEFLSAPDAEELPPAATEAPPAADRPDSDSGRRRINVADLQEPPPPKPVEPEENAEDAAPEGPAAEGSSAEGPAEEEHPAMEHRTIAQPAPEDRPAAPSDALQPDPEAPRAAPPAAEEAPAPQEPPAPEERQAIAEQPTQLFDVEGQFADTAEPPAGADDSDEVIEVSGPPEEEPADEFDEFFSEQRLSDELNQALEAPLPDEPGAPSTEEAFSPFLDPDTELGPPPEGQRERDSEEQRRDLEPLFEPNVEGPLPEEDDSAEAEPPQPDSREAELPEDDSREEDLPDEPRDEGEADRDQADTAATRKAEPGHADALEDTPDFLEESPDDDDAWFEQRPPKDFDFGD